MQMRTPPSGANSIALKRNYCSTGFLNLVIRIHHFLYLIIVVRGLQTSTFLVIDRLLEAITQYIELERFQCTLVHAKPLLKIRVLLLAKCEAKFKH